MANSMTFFQIGTVNLTAWVNTRDYEMNSEDVYETWTDANWTDHRVIARQRITGKVKLGFSKPADFAAFIAAMSSQRQAGGYYSVTAYVNNTGATATFDAYIDTADADNWDLLNSRQWQVQTLTVTGR